ncbi:MAG: DMT family transporter [Acidobacteriota bacterium]|nr:DMT family transporter [Acidobacteriota bacterium]
MTSRRPARMDVLLLLMTIIWGTNYVIVKHAFRSIDPQAFNAIRLIISSTVFLTIMAAVRRRPVAQRAEGSLAGIFYTPSPITARDWLSIAGLGIVGQCLYQYCFVAGLARTSVANAALIAAAAPVLIALASAAMGEERIGLGYWLGALLSLGGIYIVVGRDLRVGGSTIRGDLIMFAAVCCWAIYTLGARPLMTRHSPVAVTGLSMAIGTLLYVPAVVPHLRAVDWRAVDWVTWVTIVYSALFALSVAYTIWYAAVRDIGSARTSVYSNLVPLVAMATAVLFLGEPLDVRKIGGAAAVLVGVALTRVKTLNPNPE